MSVNHISFSVAFERETSSLKLLREKNQCVNSQKCIQTALSRIKLD